MKGAGSRAGSPGQGFAGRVQAVRLRRTIPRRYGPPSEAVLIMILFLLLVVVLLYFS
ncbi:hypothetical protein ['Paenibacillus yunnanensis' Narsing Rao et al. 2020]|uniref:hypothetical protein n=1 Tax=Paenibacillus tengchongensis TaxID=2608684 RepID=UPI001652B12F|nr:hypothetical protein [Paenibacillus tengchongensis]